MKWNFQVVKRETEYYKLYVYTYETPRIKYYSFWIWNQEKFSQKKIYFNFFVKLKESIYFLTLICSRGSFNSGLHWISTRLDPWSKGVITTQAWINCPEIYFEKFVFKKFPQKNFKKKINLCTFDCSKSISLISSSVVVHNCHKIITDVSFFLVTFWISTKIGWHQCRHYKYVKKLLFFEAISNFFHFKWKTSKQTVAYTTMLTMKYHLH